MLTLLCTDDFDQPAVLIWQNVYEAQLPRRLLQRQAELSTKQAVSGASSSAVPLTLTI
jgi:hypothetical protein